VTANAGPVGRVAEHAYRHADDLLKRKIFCRDTAQGAAGHPDACRANGLSCNTIKSAAGVRHPRYTNAPGVSAAAAVYTDAATSIFRIVRRQNGVVVADGLEMGAIALIPDIDSTGDDGVAGLF